MGSDRQYASKRLSSGSGRGRVRVRGRAVCSVERVERQRLDDVQRARDSEQEGKKDMWQGGILNRWGGVGDRDEEGEILYMQSGCVL